LKKKGRPPNVYVSTEAGAVQLHHLSGLVFDELTSETARTRARWWWSRPSSPPIRDPFILNHAHYYDEWRKFADGWRIASRRFLNWGFRALGDEFFRP
jgi:hypothetical protein